MHAFVLQLAYNTLMNESPGQIRVDFNPFAGPELEFVYASTEAQREVFAAADWGAEASCAFNESWSVRLVGLVDLGAFAKAAQALVDRHEALRSVLTPDGANVCVCRTLPCGLEVKNSDLQEHLRREVETPFDLVKGPLFRMALLTVQRNEAVFVFTAHHVICDRIKIVLEQVGLVDDRWRVTRLIPVRIEHPRIENACRGCAIEFLAHCL